MRVKGNGRPIRRRDTFCHEPKGRDARRNYVMRYYRNLNKRQWAWEYGTPVHELLEAVLDADLEAELDALHYAHPDNSPWEWTDEQAELTRRDLIGRAEYDDPYSPINVVPVSHVVEPQVRAKSSRAPSMPMPDRYAKRRKTTWPTRYQARETGTVFTF